MITTRPCVCVQHVEATNRGGQRPNRKTTGRRRVCSLTHGLLVFISLLQSLSSSSKRNRIVFYSLLQVLKDYETLSNGRGNV